MCACLLAHSVGVAARLGIRIANLMRPLGILYGDRGLPTLAGLTNDSDIATIKANLYSYGTQMEVSEDVMLTGTQLFARGCMPNYSAEHAFGQGLHAGLDIGL
jgi:hypothetical protein